MNKRGQSLIEVLIGVAVGILFIAGTVGILALTLRIHFQNRFSQAAGELSHGLATQLATASEANWHIIFDVSPHGTANQYHLIESGNFFVAASGTETILSGDQTYTRWFTIEDVYRDSNDTIVASGGTLDPSTLLATINLTWTQGTDTATIQLVRYLTRNRSRVFAQTDWSGGASQEGPITSVNSLFASSSNMEINSPAGSVSIQNLSVNEASSTDSNIDATNEWAWNDVIGWISFKQTNTVTVSSTGLTGYASSNIGYIALDCATSPNPDCTHPYQVANDGAGTLSGWAWNDMIGWISFASTSGAVYGVTIDNDGNFSGWAWNDVIGWISFNCSNQATCGTSNYKVKSSWSATVIQAELFSSIFDTQISGGSAFNSLLWQGLKPTGTAAKFQISSSNNASGPWTYLGPDGTESSYYEPAGPNVQIKIIRNYHNNRRYVRYRTLLESDANKSLTPRLDDIIIGWSP